MRTIVARLADARDHARRAADHVATRPLHAFWQIDDAIVYNVACNEASPLADRLDRLIQSLS